MIKIQSSRDLARQNGVKAVIYGRSGVGKTTLVTTAPHPLFISAEAGLLSIRNHDIPVVEITTLAEMQELFTFVSTSAEAKDYWTLYLDSLSEIAEVVLANEMRKSKDPRQIYPALLSETVNMIRSFRDIPQKHVVMVAKEEKSSNGIHGPSLPGSKLGNAIPYLFDEVLRLGIGQTPEGESYRFIQTGPDLLYDAKDRSGILDMYEKPNLTEIFNKIIA